MEDLSDSKEVVAKELNLPIVQEIHRIFNYWIYLEHDSAFGLGGRKRQVDDRTEVIKFYSVQRAIGVLEGIVQKFDFKTRSGEIEVEGRQFSFRYVEGANRWRRSKNLEDLVGKLVRFTFWPSSENSLEELRKEGEKLSSLKFVGIRNSKTPSSGYVEIVGKLEQIWPGSFVVAIWSPRAQRLFRVVVAGDYPYPDEVGKFVWVVGKFEVDSGVIRLQEANVIAFIPKEEVNAIFHASRKPSKVESSLPKTSREARNETLWKALQKEIQRTMVNVKLKVVLRELPANIQELDDMVWIPLESYAKVVPGGVQLPNTSIDLLITKKMWKKAQKSAFAIQEEKGTPIHIIEALIGIKENKLSAVASTIQVMAAKTQDASPENLKKEEM